METPLPKPTTPEIGSQRSIYFNGFQAGMSTSDIFLSLERNGANVVVVNMSYTVAKSLGIALRKLIEDLETQTGRNIMTTQDVAKALLARPTKGESV